MVPRRLEPGNAPQRRFFLDRSPLEGRPELSPRETEHALRVLRLQAGDELIGMDGKGRSWPLLVQAVDKRRAVLERIGDPELEQRPGEPGAALAWIEIALVLPRGGHAEEIVSALTQLGAAAITPICSERSQPEARQLSEARAERLKRVTQEACKQCGRLWLPVLSAVQPLADWLAARPSAETLGLAPDADLAISEWLDRRIEATRANWSEAAPLCIVVGPEGGFSTAEEDLLRARGSHWVQLGPHTLRIETAASAALSIVAERVFRARRS